MSTNSCWPGIWTLYKFHTKCLLDCCCFRKTGSEVPWRMLSQFAVMLMGQIPFLKILAHHTQPFLQPVGMERWHKNAWPQLLGPKQRPTSTSWFWKLRKPLAKPLCGQDGYELKKIATCGTLWYRDKGGNILTLKHLPNSSATKRIYLWGRFARKLISPCYRKRQRQLSRRIVVRLLAWCFTNALLVFGFVESICGLEPALLWYGICGPLGWIMHILCE